MMVLDNRERAARIAMCEDALASHTDATDPRVHQQLLDMLAQLRETAPNAPTAALPNDDVRVGREAGSPAANQYGTFAVHAASPAQVRYLSSLIAERNTDGIKIPTTLDGISKKAASALLDKLIDRPRKAGVAAPTGRPASERQVAYMTSLWNERDWAGVIAGVPFDIDTTKPVPTLDGPQTSKVIDALRAAPRKVARPVVEIAAGAYRVGDRVIRVYLGQQSGKMLATELVDPTATTRDDAWRYLGMASRFVPADAHRMTVEECEAASVGTADHGWCCVCGRGLDDPKSVARGIGPVCRAKQG